MRKFGRVDANQKEIFTALRRIGANCQSLASQGGGVPDALVAFRGKWFVAEIKDGSKPPSQRKLTPDEELWHSQFNRTAKVSIWNSVEEAIAEVTA